MLYMSNQLGISIFNWTYIGVTCKPTKRKTEHDSDICHTITILHPDKYPEEKRKEKRVKL